MLIHPTGKQQKAFRDYGLEMEIGSIDVPTHVISDKYGKTLYSVSDDLFEPKSPMQRIPSACLQELLLDFATDMSYRSVEKRINRIRWQTTGISSRTVCNIIEREGKAMEASLESQSQSIFNESGFTPEGLPQEGCNIEKPPFVPMEHETIMVAATQLGLDSKISHSDYESQETVVNVSLDDVLTKRQVSERPDSVEKGGRKYNSNTVIHVHKKSESMTLVAGNVAIAMRQLIALVLHLGLAGSNAFVFFTDGASDLHGAIKRLFKFQNYKIILDWHHLSKKLEQRLSSACTGRKTRNTLLAGLRPLLWKGEVEAAIKYLSEIPDDSLKAPQYITKLIDYLRRNKNYIPCYALRKELGLRNSSNRGEKANDLVVSHRQKHDGMSWSPDGSSALAVVSATCRNGQLVRWTHNREVAFELSTLEAAA